MVTPGAGKYVKEVIFVEDIKFFELEVPEETNECHQLVNTKYNAFAYVLWAPYTDPFCADKSELKG